MIGENARIPEIFRPKRELGNHPRQGEDTRRFGKYSQSFR
jgi:hypothetical protein